jgi:uncharacterized membrane protein YjgN (DUF898 family)
VFTLGIAYPYAVVLQERWKAKHTYIQGRQLQFTGTGLGLFGLWIKWFLLCIVTLGIYSFWVQPRLQKWIVENTDFVDTKPAQSRQHALLAPRPASQIRRPLVR